MAKFEFKTYTDLNWFELTYNKCGYFDGRPQINIFLYFISFIIILPWINKKWTDECDPPNYGIGIHNGTLWLYLGGNGNMYGGNKWLSWDLPWFTKNHYKHYVLGKDNKWIDVSAHDYDWFEKHIGYLNWDLEANERSLAKIYYDTWHDDYDNTDISAKYRVEARIWRPKWFAWTSLFQTIEKYITVSFEYEVGSEKGTWKGGTIGASFEFKDSEMDRFPETPKECFERMNREKSW